MLKVWIHQTLHSKGSVDTLPVLWNFEKTVLAFNLLFHLNTFE